jgi:phosphatidylinositol alpha-1,6-mannosyltransferase
VAARKAGALRRAYGRAYGLAVSNTWPPMSAGSGRAFAQLVAGLPGITALVPRIGASPSDPPWVRRVLRFSGRSGGPLKLHTALQHLEIVLAPIRHARTAGPPAFTFTSQPLFSGIGALLLQITRGVPYLLMIHGEELTGCAAERTWFRPRRRLLDLALRHAAAIVCNADHTRELAVLAGIAPSRLHVIRPGLDLDEFTDPDGGSFRPQPGMLLMVGRLWQAHKGFDTAIAALPRVLDRCPHASLMIVGPGDPAPLRALARTHGVEGRVRFEGEVARSRLLELYRECTVFVMPGRTVDGTAEGFGLVYLEAAAFGRPAVAGRAGGAGEAVLDGETGLVVDGEDVTAVAEAVIVLLEDPAYADRLGRAARERVFRDFDSSAQRRALRRVIAAAVPEAHWILDR